MTVFPPPHPDGTPIPDVPAHAEFSLVEALNNQDQDEQDIEAVTKYLKQHLHWRVQTVYFPKPIVEMEADLTVVRWSSC